LLEQARVLRVLLLAVPAVRGGLLNRQHLELSVVHVTCKARKTNYFGALVLLGQM